VSLQRESTSADFDSSTFPAESFDPALNPPARFVAVRSPTVELDCVVFEEVESGRE